MEYSELDKNGVVKTMLVRSHLFKPLKQLLLTGENNLSWLLYGVKNEPKFYYSSTASSDNTADASESQNLIEIREDLLDMEEVVERVVTSASEQNKYIEMYNSLNPYFTPFDNVINDTGAIIQLEVKNDMNVIPNNDGNYKTEVISSDKLNTKRFAMMKYNTGLTRLEQVSTNKTAVNASVVNLTPPDKIMVNSIVTLPIPIILFSKVNLPGTNILERANLGYMQLNYWKFLNEKTKVKPIELATNQTKEEMELEEREKERLERGEQAGWN